MPNGCIWHVHDVGKPFSAREGAKFTMRISEITFGSGAIPVNPLVELSAVNQNHRISDEPLGRWRVANIFKNDLRAFGSVVVEHDFLNGYPRALLGFLLVKLAPYSARLEHTDDNNTNGKEREPSSKASDGFSLAQSPPSWLNLFVGLAEAFLCSGLAIFIVGLLRQRPVLQNVGLTCCAVGAVLGFGALAWASVPIV